MWFCITTYITKERGPDVYTLRNIIKNCPLEQGDLAKIVIQPSDDLLMSAILAVHKASTGLQAPSQSCL